MESAIKNRIYVSVVALLAGILASLPAAIVNAAVAVGSTNVYGINAFERDSKAFGSIAAGRTHVVQVNYTDMRICDKVGNCGNQFPIKNLFQNPSCSQAHDPLHAMTAYDSLADRYIVAMGVLQGFVSPIPGVCVAVSKTGNAEGSYHQYYFPTGITPGHLNNFGQIGVWPDGYYMTFWEAPDLFVFRRSHMLDNLAATDMWRHFVLPQSNFVPSHLTGTTPPPAGAPNILFALRGHFDDDGGHTHDGQLLEGIRAIGLSVDWNNSANTRFVSDTFMPFTRFGIQEMLYALCPTYPSGRCVGQLNTDVQLSGQYGYLQGPVNYRNMGSHQSYLLAHNIDLNGNRAPIDPARPTIAWHEVRLNGWIPFRYQGGQYGDNQLHYWMGNMAMNKDGDIGLIYNVSSPTIRPELRITGRRAADALTTMPQGQTTIVASTSSIDFTGSSAAYWGPQALTPDPDGCTFWSTGMYVFGGLWGTRITNSSFPSCNMARGDWTTASTANVSNRPDYATDGNLSTSWGTSASFAWLRVDLGSVTTFKRVKLRWNSAYATAFQIQSSNDGVSWFNNYTTTTGTGGIQTIDVRGTARYIRLNMTQRASLSGYSLAEFEVFPSL